MTPLLRRIGREVASFGVALAVWFTLRSLVFATFHIDSGSMERTLLVGDVLVINRTLYGAEVPIVHTRLPVIREPRRGEVVVFESVETPGLDVIKRVIGVPGDTLAMVGGEVERNGRRLHEAYAQHDSTMPGMDLATQEKMSTWQRPFLVGALGQGGAAYHPDHWNWGPIVVPAGHLFMMGDHRDVSWDSRYWGFLPIANVKGRAELIYYSYDGETWRTLPALTAPRFSRMFTPIR